MLPRPNGGEIGRIQTVIHYVLVASQVVMWRQCNFMVSSYVLTPLLCYDQFSVAPHVLM